ncbi:1018_t:CDS:2 [Cetraspora pellucida]|uniref:1018_t:CDS:1 n=1 Tax=Cetraspora pellucida TaxID=1433469 RepID=A0A9N9HZI9_9GLOM|nr:1018_t:CDS:2 [Cetraspora pellucida]
MNQDSKDNPRFSSSFDQGRGRQREFHWKTGETINLIVGTGIFITPGSIWRLVQSPGGALIFWIIGGFIKLYSWFVWWATEKKKDNSQAYGFAFGSKPLRLLFGFATVKSNSFISAKYLLYAIGGGNGGEFEHYGHDFGAYFDKDFITLRVLAIFILAITTAYHMLAARKSSHENKQKYEHFAVCVDQILVLFKYVSLMALAIIGLCKANDPSFSSTFRDNWRSAFNYTSSNVSYPRDASEYIGGYGSAVIQELKVETTFRKYSALANICITMVLYIIVNAAFISLVDPKLVADPKNSNESIAINYGVRLFGEPGRKFMSSLIAISAFSSVDSMVTVSSSCFDEFKNIPKIHEAFLFWKDSNNRESHHNLFAQFIFCSILMLIFPAVNVYSFFSEMSEYLIMLLYGVSALYLVTPLINEPKIIFLPIFILCSLFVALAPLFPVPPSENDKIKYPYVLPYLIPVLVIFIIELLRRMQIFGKPVDNSPTLTAYTLDSPIDDRDNDENGVV